MPLHDWAALPGWQGIHQVWIVELLYWIQPRLPAGYRAYIGTTPTFAIGAPGEERPAAGVRDWPKENGPQAPAGGAATRAPQTASEEPDQEIAAATLDGDKALLAEPRDR